MSEFKDELLALAKTRVAWFIAGAMLTHGQVGDLVHQLAQAIHL